MKLTVKINAREEEIDELESKLINLNREAEVQNSNKEAEITALKNDMKAKVDAEKRKVELSDQKIQTLEEERRRARKYFADRMKVAEGNVKKAEEERLNQIQTLANKEHEIRNLKNRFNNSERRASELQLKIDRLSKEKEGASDQLVMQGTIEEIKRQLQIQIDEKRRLQREVNK